MKAYARKQSQPQQKGSLCPNMLARQTIGRQAVKASSNANAEDRRAMPVAPPETVHFAHDFSRIPVHSSTPVRLQAKLKVAAPGDEYEREADRVSDRVMATTAHPFVSGASLRIQRLEKQPSGMTDASPAGIEQVLAGSSMPLEPVLRQDMEQRFGHDFSRVRVHTDAAAEQSARDVNANAYTVGHHIVFDAGRFAPGTHDGRRLLAHELTHVIQQRAGGSDRLDSIHAHSPQAVQRQEKKKSPLELEKEESQKVVSEIETNWNSIRVDAADFDDVKPWVENGDAVVRLIREHTDLAFKALERGDPEESRAYKYALESDLIAYQLISWHVVVHVNLLALKPDINRLVEAFDADDREFTGRSEVEELIRMMDNLIDVFPGQAAQLLSQINVKSSLTVKVGATRQVQMTATNASAPEMKIKFEKEIDSLVQLQGAIQVTVSEVNAFLVTARKEGAWQAVEALVELFGAKGGKGKGRGPQVSKPKGKASKAKQDKNKKKDKDKDKDKDKKKREPFLMRFQVQWGTNQGGPTFSLTAAASADPGVTTTQAIATLNATAALVTPAAAQTAASPAVASQISWIRNRPPAGIAVGGYSKSEYFRYLRFTDARVDVENIVGHNLRK